MPQTTGSEIRPGRNLRVIAIVVLSACTLAFALSGCGSSDEKFSSDESDRALAALDAIQQYVDEGECTKAQSRVNKLALQATHINSDRPDLGDAYASSVARLQELVDRECVEITPTGPTSEPTESTGPTSEPKKDVTPTPETGGDNDTTGGGAQPDNTPGGGGQNNNGDNGNGQPNGGDQNQPDPGDSGGASPQG